MSKTRDTGFLGNVIKVDNGGNVSLVSGSTTLLSVSSSGAVTITGTISGSTAESAVSSSYALTASYSSNAELLDGMDSTMFAFTSSFNTTSASLDAGLKNVIARTGSFATTGSNVFYGNQTVSASMFVSGSVTATGQIVAQTINVQSVTSSVVYSSGSNVFGNRVSDTQTFTGSMLVTGSNALFNVGCIGIGTTTPGYKLEVCGPGSDINIIGASSGDVATGFRIGRGASLGAEIYDNPQDNITTVNAVGGLNFRSGNSSRFSLSCVGIASFTCQVCVGGTLTVNGERLVIGGTTNNAVINNIASVRINIDSDNSNVGESFAVGHNQETIDNNNVLFKVQDDGKVGIGTNSPDLTLSVSGSINMRNSTRAGAFEIDSSGNLWIGTATTAGNIYLETGHTTSGLPSTGTARLNLNSTAACFSSTVCAPIFNAVGVSRFFNAIDTSTTGYRYMEIANAGASMYYGVERSTAAGLIYNSDPYSTVWATTNATNLNFGTNLYKRLTIDCTGIATFTCQVCAPTFIASSGIRLGGYAFQFTAAKNFNENTSDVEFFKIAMGGGQAAIFVNFSSVNSGTAAYRMQTYHGLLSNNWTGWMGCGIEVTSNPSCRANFAASSINSVATYTGCLVFRVSTTNNGTSTQATGTAYILVVTDGTVPTFTQL